MSDRSRASRVSVTRLGVVMLAAAAALALALPARGATPGSQLWARRYDGLAHLGANGQAVALDPTGTRAFVAGGVNTANGYSDMVTLAYDVASGSKIWGVEYDGPAQSNDGAAAIGVSPDGATVYVTGTSFSSHTGEDFYTAAYDAATGGQRWSKRWDVYQGSIDSPTALVVSPDGSRVFVTGTALDWFAFNLNTDYATVALDASSGAKLWTRKYASALDNDDQPNGIAVSPDSGRVFVSGWAQGVSSVDYLTFGYDASTGKRLWSTPYDGPDGRLDFGRAVAASDGTVVATGGSVGLASSTDVATVAYDAATGDQLWARRFNGHTNQSDGGFAVVIRGSSVFVSGASVGPDGDDYLTIAYDLATGATLWSRRYDGSGDGGDVAWAISASLDGSRVFVTGESFGASGHTDIATLAYDGSTGSSVWKKRYNGPDDGDDVGRSIATTGDGSLAVVTGSTAGPTLASAATVAYGG